MKPTHILAHLLFLVIFGSISSLYAQTPLSGTPEFMAPDTWSFMKYGNDSPSLYTGTVNVNIPIYVYKDNNFEIPISISYASNGFIPNTHSGSVGLGWFLNAGGCITREILGMPDEMRYGREAIYDEYTKGYYSYYKYPNKPFLDLPLLDRGVYSALKFRFVQNKTNYQPSWESESDIYTFNFMGHTGKFMFGPNGIHVFNTSHPQGEYKIDVSDFHHDESVMINNQAWSRQKESRITITTGDGYKYTFGNLIKYQNPPNNTLTKEPRLDDVRITQNANNHDSPNYDYYVVDYKLKTWMLVKVESPNGHTIQFEYSEPEYVASMKYSGLLIDQSGKYYFKVPLGKSCGSYSTSNSSLDNVFTINKYEIATVQLTKMHVDNNFEINFSYQNREKYEMWKYYFYGGYQTVLLDGCKQLSKIIVKNLIGTPQILKECSFSYGYPKTTGNNVLLLKNISIAGEGSYKMNYINEMFDFPFQATAAFDNWGYYNFYNSNSDDTYGTKYAFLRNITVDSNFKETQNDPYRNPNFSGAKYGMLEKLTYPTGGYTIYEYEPHSYSNIVYRDYSSQNKPTLRSCNETITGGVRIKKITDYSNEEGIGNCREFIYNENIKGSSASTGNLLHMPRYWFQSEIEKRNGKDYMLELVTFRSITDLQAFSASKNHIEYKTVYEKFNNGSYMKYSFSDYAAIPDIIDISKFTEFKAGGTVPLNILFPQYANNYLAHPVSLSGQRGKLISIKHYRFLNDILEKSEEYFYDKNRNLGYLESVKSTEPGGNIIYVYKTFIDDYPLIKKEIYDHLNTQRVGKTINYTYNAQGQIVGEETICSDGTKILNNTQYVSDIPSASRTSTDNTMINRNILQYPIKQKTSISEFGNTYKMTAGERNTFALSNNLVILDTTSSTKLTEPVVCSNYSFDGYLTTDLNYIHDSQGNIRQVTDRSGMVITYLWGYNNMYPVAKIENAAFSQVQGVIGSTLVNNIASSFTLTNSQLSSLETLRGQIPDIKMTIYLYKPLVGITCIIDPSGRRITYEYDSYNRLRAIRDDKNNQLNEYEYHFTNPGK